MSPWVPVAITVVLGVMGLGIQALLLAYFIGKMKEQQNGQKSLVEAFQKFTDQAIASLVGRIASLDDVTTESKVSHAALNARLMTVEHNTEGLQTLRETFAGHAATFLAFKERMESDSAAMKREMAVANRQLANIATGRVGEVVELEATGPG